MRLTTAAIASVLITSSLAGLEDAKFSTKLTAANFDSEIGSVEIGTLVAYYAPWCGHCKSLEPAWTEAAKVYEGNSRCRIAHLDADDSTNRPVGTKYGVNGFPTLKFVSPDGTATDYSTQRSAAAILAFMEEQGCGRSETEGRIPILDSIASEFFAPSATRPSLLASASALASSLSESTAGLSAYYLKVMAKFSEDAAGGAEYLTKETKRLGKLINSQGNIAAKKLDELRSKQNILSAFNYQQPKEEKIIKEEL